jgi:hypothetical protein
METDEQKDKEQLNAAQLRQPKIKEALVEQLKRIPIIQISCERAGVSRASFYRWRDEDEEFKKAIEKALSEGEAYINDMSESQMISLIKDKNWPAISFWLRHHHPKYVQRIEISANISQPQEELTAEQAEVVKDALRLASLAAPEEKPSEEELSANQNQKNEQKSNGQQSTEPTGAAS